MAKDTTMRDAIREMQKSRAKTDPLVAAEPNVGESPPNLGAIYREVEASAIGGVTKALIGEVPASPGDPPFAPPLISRTRYGIMCIQGGKVLIVEADESIDLDAAFTQFRLDFSRTSLEGRGMQSASFPPGVRVRVLS